MTEIVPSPLVGQAALFEDPSRLLQLGDGEWAQLVAEAKMATGPMVAQMRRVGGLLAWAGWHRLSERNYSGFVTDLADHFGVDDGTVRRWRRKVVAAEHLAVPALASLASEEAVASAVTRQKGRSEGGPRQNARRNREPRNEEPVPRNSERPPLASVPDSVGGRIPPTRSPEPWPPKPTQYLEDMLGWLIQASTADIAAVPAHLRKGLMGAMRRWIRTLEDAPVPQDVSVADCTHPVSRRIGSRCAACGGKP